MEIDEAWMPIISQSIEWVRGKMGPSKKDLQIKIDELQEKVNYVVNSDTILQINQDGNSILNMDMDGMIGKTEQTKLDSIFYAYCR